MQAKKDHVLVKISPADRAALFEKPILLPSGELAFMTIDEQAGENYDKSYAQSVSVGTIVSVGRNVTCAKVGDTALLDYIADHLDNYIVKDGGEKLLSLTTLTRFRGEDLIIDANRRTPKPTPVHYKGDLEDATLLIAVVRHGIIYPIAPYVFLKHVKYEKKFKNEEGMTTWSMEEETEVVERDVLFSHEGSEVTTGDTILCESSSLFDRSLNKQTFDIIFEQDIIAILENKTNG